MPKTKRKGKRHQQNNNSYHSGDVIYNDFDDKNSNDFGGADSYDGGNFGCGESGGGGADGDF
ncbi:hypothetical protein A5482_011245 [Cyanobacterium sp. IPPAS B-1200]|nr:hypothetical protein [Cyanobacterium sp. IPPAS B-1200]